MDGLLYLRYIIWLGLRNIGLIKANGYGGQNEKITQKVSDTNGSN